ncbi:MAG: CBS domain-containing protein [Kofleriaceae bacterium]
MPTVNSLSLARDVMTRDMIVIGPDTSLLDVHRLFIEEEIHGAPVVDEEDQVLGVVSTIDLLRATRDRADVDSTSSTYYRDGVGAPGVDWAELAEDADERVKSMTASDVMTRELVRVSPEATLAEVARTMLAQHVHRVLVVAQGNLVGVITTFDLLRVLAGATLPETREPTGYARS